MIFYVKTFQLHLVFKKLIEEEKSIVHRLILLMMKLRWKKSSKEGLIENHGHMEIEIETEIEDDRANMNEIESGKTNILEFISIQRFCLICNAFFI